MAITLEKLLRLIPRDTEARIDATRKKWTRPIRNMLRNATALYPNRRTIDANDDQTDMVTVPIELVPGLPTEVEDLTFDDDLELVFAISPYTAALMSADAGLKEASPLIPELAKGAAGRALLDGRHAHFSSAMSLLADLLRVVESRDPVQKILEVNSDVLGVYRYRLPDKSNRFAPDPFDGQVELYWGLIGVTAGILGVSIEGLGVVVLIHELAHAYTHVGADIDGERWASLAFSKSDHGLKEGLAQYYTALVCERLKAPLPDAWAAYTRLLVRQPPPYKTHVSWLKDHNLEEVRSAMLSVRRGVGSLADFNKALQDSKTRLRPQIEEPAFDDEE